MLPWDEKCWIPWSKPLKEWIQVIFKICTCFWFHFIIYAIILFYFHETVADELIIPSQILYSLYVCGYMCFILSFKHSLAHCLPFISGYSLLCVWWRTVKCDSTPATMKKKFIGNRGFDWLTYGIFESSYSSHLSISATDGWNCHKTFGDNQFFIIPKKPKRVNIN